MPQLTQQQATAFRIIVDAVIDAVRAAGPLGAPGGTLYAALQTQGCTFNQFTSLMAVLVRTGRLRKERECYFLPAG